MDNLEIKEMCNFKNRREMSKRINIILGLVLVFSTLNIKLQAQCKDATIPVAGTPVLSDYKGIGDNVLTERMPFSLLKVVQDRSNFGFMWHFQQFYKSMVCYNEDLISRFMNEPLVNELRACVESFELEVYNGILRFRSQIEAEALYDTLIYFSNSWDNLLEENPDVYEQYIVSEKFPNYPMLFAFEKITGFNSLRAHIENQILELEAGDGIPEDNNPEHHFIVSPYMRTILTPNCEIAISLFIFIIGDEYTVEIADLNMENLQATRNLIRTLGEEEGMKRACLEEYANQVDADKYHKSGGSGTNCCDYSLFGITAKPSKNAAGCKNKYDFEVGGNFPCGTPISYEWTVDGTVFSYQAAPSYQFDRYGLHFIKVILKFDNGKTCELTEQVDVDYCKARFSKHRDKNKHTFTFVPATLKQCEDDEVIKWEWNFGDGSPKYTTTNPNEKVEHTYSKNGKYTVTLTITTKKGCVASFSRKWVIAKKSDCCYPSDKKDVIYYYSYGNNQGKVEHTYAANKVVLRFVVKSINYVKNKKGNWNREKADRLRVNYEGVVYDKDCITSYSTNGNALSNTKNNSITYDKGFGKAFRLKKNCTWSVYEVDKGSHKSGQYKGVYLHQLCN